MNRSDSIKAGPGLGSRDLALYGATVLLWGTSWIALRAQLGVIAPEVSILWRFLIAAVGMWIWVVAAREPVVFPWRDHVRFIGTGLCLFSINFILFYYGGLTIPSGLLAVIFSLASIFNLLLGALLLGQRVEPAVAAGGIVGAVGIALLFWPELSTGMGGGALTGLVLCVLGTIVFCLGNMVSTVTQQRGIPLPSTIAWSMSYGVAVLALLSILRGQAFVIEPTLRYIASLVWLALGASIVAFACYLTLLRRIGAARAGYATVLFPLVALAVSTAFEGYRWTWLAAGGVVLALVGNLLVLQGGRR
jgi:drug/metabolite transporter (DMT)-like permease